MHVREAQDDADRSELLGLLVGPWLAYAVSAAVELGVVDRIAREPAGPRELAEELGLRPEPLYRLLRALAAIGILAEDPEGAFAPTGKGRLLSATHPGSMRDLALLYTSGFFTDAWKRLGDSVRTGEPAFRTAHGTDIYGYLHTHPADSALFDAGMSVGSSFAAELPAVVDFSAASRIVDVGGGDGSVLAGLLMAHAHLSGVLFERPDVMRSAEGRLGTYVAEGRCRAVPGDFFREVPAGGDVYLLCRVLHNWDAAAARTILANCRAAMPADGLLLILERIVPGHGPGRGGAAVPDRGPEPRGTAAPDRDPAWLALAFDLNMMVMTAGRERTAAEYDELLGSAGLRTREVRDLAGEMRVLVAAPG
ncbi:methyltransferase [Nocardiopsis mangrovi]|uniref:Methyltransferase n=1 Tax=Nocardiopsis mangrovi TaxID=1179818 RepID=A0ABV9E041_9ACTN